MLIDRSHHGRKTTWLNIKAGFLSREASLNPSFSCRIKSITSKMNRYQRFGCCWNWSNWYIPRSDSMNFQATRFCCYSNPSLAGRSSIEQFVPLRAGKPRDAFYPFDGVKSVLFSKTNAPSRAHWFKVDRWHLEESRDHRQRSTRFSDKPNRRLDLEEPTPTRCKARWDWSKSKRDERLQVKWSNQCCTKSSACEDFQTVGWIFIYLQSNSILNLFRLGWILWHSNPKYSHSRKKSKLRYSSLVTESEHFTLEWPFYVSQSWCCWRHTLC